MSLSSINFLHLMVSEIKHGQDFIGQGHYGKVKSRSHHDDVHLHPLTKFPGKYQLPTPHGFSDIAHTRFYRSRSHHDLAHLQPLTNAPTKYQPSYTLWFQRHSPDKIFKLKVNAARSKVNSRSHPNVSHLHTLTNVPTKYQLHTPHGFRDIARTRFYRSRSLWQGKRSNQGHTMIMHTYTTYPMSLVSINFLHLMVSQI